MSLATRMTSFLRSVAVATHPDVYAEAGGVTQYKLMRGLLGGAEAEHSPRDPRKAHWLLSHPMQWVPPAA